MTRSLFFSGIVAGARPLVWSSSEAEGFLRFFWRPDANALQFEHASLCFRAAGSGESADFAARGQHPMTGNDQRRWVSRHRLPRRRAPPRGPRRPLSPARHRWWCAPSRPGAERHRSSKQRALAGKVEPNLREVHILASKVPFRRLDDRRNLFRQRARLCAKSAAAHQLAGGLGAFHRQLKARDPRVAPGDCAEAHSQLKDMIMLGAFAHWHRFPFAHLPKMRRQTPNATRFLSPDRPNSAYGPAPH